MTVETILIALNGVDDKYLMSYTPIHHNSSFEKKQKQSAKSLWRWISVAACFMLIICAVPIAVHFIKTNNAPDPHWHETHVQLTDQNEAIAMFGDDLLLDRIIVPGVADSLYQEYILEHSGKDPANISTWEYLHCWLRYGVENYYDRPIEEVDIIIYFSDTLEQTRYNEFLTYHKGETELGSIEINGLTVNYYSKQETNSVTSGAWFTFNGLGYSITGNNYELVMKTVYQMLD